MFVLTIDQRGSRRAPDQVDQLLRSLRTVPVVRGFERTAGDEVQGVFGDPTVVIDTCLALVHQAAWSVGIGVGVVETPLPRSTRAGRGPAFSRARTAVESAKARVTHLAVIGPHPHGTDAQAVLDLLVVAQQRRSAEGWEAVSAMVAGQSQTAVAAEIGVSKQAVSQRLRAAGWAQDVAGRQAAARLLAEADRAQR